jgi:uncharacterized protein YdaU (DUF1376 family)
VAPRRLFYQKFFWFDFMGDTLHMTGFEKGIYALCIGNYFINRGPLPDDDHRLALMTALTVEQWRSVRPTIEKCFQVRDGLWHHKRIERDLAEDDVEREGKREGARKTNEKRNAKRDAHRDAERTQLQSQSPVQSQSAPVLEPKPHKAIVKRVGNALEEGLVEEMMRRTRDVVGEAEMAGRKYGFWKTLLHDDPNAYIRALEDAESRKKEALAGLPEMQIRKTWAHYLTYTFKSFKKGAHAG